MMTARNFVAVVCFVGLVVGTDWKAVTIEEPPYVIIENGEYKGYIPDVVAKIRTESGNNFTFHTVHDKKYGSKEHGKWNGMIGEVMDHKANLAAGPLTISQERKADVNFTTHFMTFDTVVLMKKDPLTNSIESAHEMLKHTDLKYGVVKDGFTENFFKNTDYDVYKQLYNNMDKGNLPNNSRDGVKRVIDGNGKYAFIIDSSTADYWVKKAPCNLRSFRLGSWLPSHEYAFVVRKGDYAVTNAVNEALERLKKNGELDMLKAKYWKNECSSAAGMRAAAVFTVLGAVAFRVTNMLML